MTTGEVFTNGTGPLHAVGFNWHERLTVIRTDTRMYGTTRYLVSDRNGRHGYALPTEV